MLAYCIIVTGLLILMIITAIAYKFKYDEELKCNSDVGKNYESVLENSFKERRNIKDELYELKERHEHDIVIYKETIDKLDHQNKMKDKELKAVANWLEEVANRAQDEVKLARKVCS